MDFQTMRIYGSIAVILGCFLFLYPKLLHPIVMSLFGLNSSPKESKADDFVPPALRDRQMGGAHPGGGDLPEHIRKMRGPHPGMRAAAAEQSKQTKGSGRGMMGVILPMYAVGIVVYLVYTLFKVFGKNDKGGNRRSPSREPPVTTGYDSGQQGDEQGRVSEKKGETLTQQDLKCQLEQLQSLAHNVNSNDMKEMDMRKLQERLAETEAQMTKILAAMQAVQTKVGETAPTVNTASDKPEKPEENLEGKAEEMKEPSNVSDRSSEGSESYEIVSKSDRESSGDENSPRKVETLTGEAEKKETGEQGAEDEECQEEEVREEILKDKEENSGDEAKTVRKRITKKEESES
ncbi:resistance to inhibitors of cholinesterase protein 3-like isoform X2 [Mercenaria mercenaria]|uniref:resistance to inhibitors of cholinesterase protein 3-like isoform X2 n=1 Tax=Mercenaria mercenaria TaxID=6596 RepID=UPI00234ECB96|nr:resistance to inhibitors of cholinesterase protein 3-like isoform X2 [Mercenaria mercenaria]